MDERRVCFRECVCVSTKAIDESKRHETFKCNRKALEHIADAVCVCLCVVDTGECRARHGTILSLH